MQPDRPPKSGADRNQLSRPFLALAIAQAGLAVFAALTEVRAPSPSPPNLAAALSFSGLFVPPAIAGFMRWRQIRQSPVPSKEARAAAAATVMFASIAVNLAVYRASLVLGSPPVVVGIAVVLFVVALSSVLYVAFFVISRNASGPDIAVDGLDALAIGVGTIGLFETLAGPDLGFSSEELGFRAWIVVSSLIIGFFAVQRLRGYAGGQFASQNIAPIAATVFCYSCYVALSQRWPQLPYWPDPVLRSAASASSIFLVLAQPQESPQQSEQSMAARRHSAVWPVLAVLGMVLGALLGAEVLARESATVAVLGGVAVVMCGLILARQYASYVAGKQLYTETQRAAERYREIVEEVPEPIIELAADGKITLVNPAFCEAFDVTPEQVIGHELRLLVESLRGRLDVAPKPRLRSPEGQSAGHPETDLPGEIRIVYEGPRGRKVFDATGAVSPRGALQLVLRDVSEQVELDKQIAASSQKLVEKDREKGELLLRLLEAFEDERAATASRIREGPASSIADAVRKLHLAKDLLNSREAAELSHRNETGRANNGKTGEGASALDKAGSLIRQAREDVSKAVQELRKAVDELRPTLLQQKGLEAAVRSQAHEILRGSVEKLSFEWRAEPRFSYGQEHLIFRALKALFLGVKGMRGVESVQIRAQPYKNDGLTVDVVVRFDPPHLLDLAGLAESALPSEWTGITENVYALGGELHIRRIDDATAGISISVESIQPHPAKAEGSVG
jgi:PAS domain-containing protein